MPAATCTASTAAVGADDSGSDKSAYQQDSGCDYEDDAFHGCFLLVTADWTVIFSRRKSRLQWVRKPLIVRNL
jgi:hypothetical protein